MAKTVSVIIPTYNGRDLLEENLVSVIAAKVNPKNAITEIIVVDDGSDDDTVSFLKKNFREVRLIKHKKNRRFAASINTGAKMAKGTHLALLNNDVAASNNFLVKPLSHFSDKSVFAVSLHEKGYGASFGKFVDGFIVHEGQKESAKVVETFWASGGSCILDRKVFLKIGAMDEDLLTPFYWEDIDLCYRAMKRGYKILWEPNSHVVHNHESTNSKISKKYRIRIQERNQLLFIWKNLTSKVYIRKHITGLIKRIIKHPGYIIIFIMAVFKFPIVLKRRKREKKESKISDEAIFSSFS